MLRFYGVWDDTASEYGERRYLIVTYFLADDTVEITEVVQPNSGRDGSATFLKRCKLPKDASSLVKQPGTVCVPLRTSPRLPADYLGCPLPKLHPKLCPSHLLPYPFFFVFLSPYNLCRRACWRPTSFCIAPVPMCYIPAVLVAHLILPPLPYVSPKFGDIA